MQFKYIYLQNKIEKVYIIDDNFKLYNLFICNLVSKIFTFSLFKSFFINFIKTKNNKESYNID